MSIIQPPIGDSRCLYPAPIQSLASSTILCTSCSAGVAWRPKVLSLRSFQIIQLMRKNINESKPIRDALGWMAEWQLVEKHRCWSLALAGVSIYLYLTSPLIITPSDLSCLVRDMLFLPERQKHKCRLTFVQEYEMRKLLNKKQLAFLFVLTLFSSKWQCHHCCCLTSVKMPDSMHDFLTYEHLKAKWLASKDSRFLLWSTTKRKSVDKLETPSSIGFKDTV